MSRAWRIEYPGALYHVLSRGNEWRNIFVDDGDRRMFLDTLGEMVELFELDVAAYVLMGNHYHLLLRTRRANLSKSMQWLGVTYTNYAYGKKRTGLVDYGTAPLPGLTAGALYQPANGRPVRPDRFCSQPPHLDF